MNILEQMGSKKETANEFKPIEICKGNFVEEIISDLEFKQNVILTNIKFNERGLEFRNCNFSNLQFKEIEMPTTLCFRSCCIDWIRIYKGNMQIKFIECNVNILETENSTLDRIIFEDSVVETVSIEGESKIRDELSISAASSIEKINFKDASVNKIRIHRSRVALIHVNGEIKNLEVVQGGSLERFSIDDKIKLKEFLINLKKEKIAEISAKTSIARSRKRVYVAAYTRYDEEKRYQEMDICLVELRKIENNLHRVEAKTKFKKASYIIQDLLVGKMFGWGVSLYNVCFTSISTIGVFAIIYGFFLAKKYENKWHLVVTCIWQSINRFFGVNDFEIFPYFDTLESIVGVIILTIMTGILARKIIR